MAQQLSDPGSSGGGGVRPIAQYGTKKADTYDVGDKQTSVIWNLKMFEIGGIEEYIELCGRGGGEYIKFKVGGYYRIDISVSVYLTDTYSWLRVVDANDKRLKSIAMNGKHEYSTASSSLIAKINKGDQKN